MGRLRLGAILALSLAALSRPVRAAEITNVASADPDHLFNLHITMRWDRIQERAKITREQADPSLNPPFGEVVSVDELRYTRVKNAFVSRIAIGLYRDLELHTEIPYVLGDDDTWRYATVNGLPVEPTSTIRNNAVDAMNQPCPIPAGETQPRCELFPVAPSTTVFHGGRMGDVLVGLAWGIFNDRRDDTKPFWLVGADVTLPTSSLYDPVAGRETRTTWSSPYSVSGNTGPVGEKVWKWDLYTVLSRRLGPIDPYFRAHVTGMTRSSQTYSNCLHADELSTRTPAEMTLAGAQNCKDPSWEEDAGAQLPWVAGLLFGTEVVPYENKAEEQKVTIDVRLYADYTSSQRFYNQLTDASGKIHRTDPFLTAGALLGVYLRASRYVSLHADASLAMETSHFLTGESLGRAGVTSGDVTGVTANPNLNPNFDWRYDPPGRRFRITEDAIFAFSVAGVLQF
jgi:hypothetical protein